MHLSFREKIKVTLDEALEICNRNRKKWVKGIPIRAQIGVYNLFDYRNTHKDSEMVFSNYWEAGFGAGIFALCYEITKDKKYLERIATMNASLDYKKMERKQSMGLLTIPTYYANYSLLHKEEDLKKILAASDMLFGQFTEKGEYFRCYEDYTNFAVDCIVQLSLMHVATKLSGDDKYYKAAEKHIKTMNETVFRSDGSTYQIYWIDNDGKRVHGSTGQGHSDESCWARGQAWAMFGYAIHYGYTKNPDYLYFYKIAANYFFDNLGENNLPKWDLIFKSNEEPDDSSAAVIAVCAALEALRHAPKDKEVCKLKEKADMLMCTVIDTCAISFDDYIDGLILRGTDVHREGSTDNCLIYGDYFYLEALARYLDYSNGFWE